MKALDEPDAPDSTPLTPEDVEGLIPTWVATHAELNECEQENIESAIRWAFSRRGHRAVSEVGALLTSEIRKPRIAIRRIGAQCVCRQVRATPVER